MMDPTVITIIGAVVVTVIGAVAAAAVKIINALTVMKQELLAKAHVAEQQNEAIKDLVNGNASVGEDRLVAMEKRMEALTDKLAVSQEARVQDAKERRVDP